MLTGGVWDTYVAVVDLLGRQPERVAMLGTPPARRPGRMSASTREQRSTASSSTRP